MKKQVGFKVKDEEVVLNDLECLMITTRIENIKFYNKL